MKFIDDLSFVKPDEILHYEGDEVIGIYRTSDTKNTWLVVMKKSSGNNWWGVYGPTIDSFIYKPKKGTLLKPLHQILNENPGYTIEDNGTIIVANVEIYNYQLKYFNGKTVPLGWPISFYTAIEA